MNKQQTEVACTTFLGIASRDLKEGRNLHALQLFGSLAKVEFTRQSDARLGEATALARMGLFQEADKKLKKIVTDYSEPTVFKADSLRAWAEVKIGLGNYERIDQILEEAAQIYSDQGLTKSNGAVVHLQGVVAMRQGDLEGAVEKLKWATMLTEIKIPEVVPSGFGSIETVIDQSSDLSARALTEALS